MQTDWGRDKMAGILHNVLVEFRLGEESHMNLNDYF